MDTAHQGGRCRLSRVHGRRNGALRCTLARKALRGGVGGGGYASVRPAFARHRGGCVRRGRDRNACATGRPTPEVGAVDARRARLAHGGTRSRAAHRAPGERAAARSRPERLEGREGGRGGNGGQVRGWSECSGGARQDDGRGSRGPHQGLDALPRPPRRQGLSSFTTARRTER